MLRNHGTNRQGNALRILHRHPYLPLNIIRNTHFMTPKTPRQTDLQLNLLPPHMTMYLILILTLELLIGGRLIPKDHLELQRLRQTVDEPERRVQSVLLEHHPVDFLLEFAQVVVVFVFAVEGGQLE